MAFKDNAVELEERVVAVNRVTKVVKGGVVFVSQLLLLLVTTMVA
ncbi:30S ribosomal protein S5 [Streptococcus pneumoniae]|nr:30S ribosomal protein S5 [Streptococcus pneumoniae]